MLLHMPTTSIHLASASHPRVLSTRCPPWASLSFPCRTLDLSVTISWCLWHQVPSQDITKSPPSILHLLVSLVLAALLGHLCAPSCTNQLQPPRVIVSGCFLPSWSISILPDMQVTFVPVVTSFLDVRSTRCPPGTSPSPSIFQLSPSALHRILVSLAPGALLGVPPRFSSLRGRRTLPAASWHLYTRSRSPRCSAPHWHLMPRGSYPQIQHPRDIPHPPHEPSAWLCHPARGRDRSLTLLRLCHRLSWLARTGENQGAADPASSFPTLQPTSPATWVPRR